jgi:enterochelin esterase-like enzyme
MKSAHWLFTILLAGAAGCVKAPAPVQPTPTATNFPCAESGAVNRVAIDTVTEVYIYLPPCYAEQADRSFPVLYLFPGYGGTNNSFLGGGAERIADESIRKDEIPPFIIVGVADPFPDIDAATIPKTVQPYVDAHYRTLAERRFRAAAGGSFGGAVAYHLAFRRSDLFGSAGIFGNGAGAGEEESIRAWLAAIPKADRPRVFINVGESDTYMLERAQALIPLLDEAGISHEEIFSPGGHSGAYWISNFAEYFRWLAADWR